MTSRSNTRRREAVPSDPQPSHPASLKLATQASAQQIGVRQAAHSQSEREHNARAVNPLWMITAAMAILSLAFAAIVAMD